VIKDASNRANSSSRQHHTVDLSQDQLEEFERLQAQAADEREESGDEPLLSQRGIKRKAVSHRKQDAKQIRLSDMLEKS
jgi:hypothetical protein